MFDISWALTTGHILLLATFLLFLGVLSSKISDGFNIPSLGLFFVAYGGPAA